MALRQLAAERQAEAGTAGGAVEPGVDLVKGWKASSNWSGGMPRPVPAIRTPDRATGTNVMALAGRLTTHWEQPLVAFHRDGRCRRKMQCETAGFRPHPTQAVMQERLQIEHALAERPMIGLELRAIGYVV